MRKDAEQELRDLQSREDDVFKQIQKKAIKKAKEVSNQSKKLEPI